MKIRNGFVSNSSSSSFVIIIPKEVADKVKETLTPYEKVVVDHIGSTEKKFGSTDIVVHQWQSGNYSSFEYFDAEDSGYKPGSDQNEENGHYDTWEKYVAAVKAKAGDSFVYVHSEF
jgi:hypothetical protein